MTIPMIENWCDQCVNGVTYNVDPLVMASLVANSASGMGPFGAPARPAGRLPLFLSSLFLSYATRNDSTGHHRQLMRI